MPNRTANDQLVLALPKGRILQEALPLLARAGIEPEAAFADENSRQLRFATNHAGLALIRVRSFDVATFVAFGAAQLGSAGNDVLMEFDYPEIYAPLDTRSTMRRHRPSSGASSMAPFSLMHSACTPRRAK